jgi:hypothetical protein
MRLTKIRNFDSESSKIFTYERSLAINSISRHNEGAIQEREGFDSRISTLRATPNLLFQFFLPSKYLASKSSSLLENIYFFSSS